MKCTTTIALLFAVLCVVSATNTDQAFTSILAQVKDDPFGEAVGSLVQMHMEAEAGPQGRVEEIADLLAEIRGTIDEQKAASKTAITSKLATCSSTLGDFTKQLDQMDKDIKDNDKEAEELADELKTKTGDLNDERSNQDKTTQDLNQSKADLETENTTYSEHKASFDEAIVACEEAIRLLQDMVKNSGKPASSAKPVMFVQLGKKFESIKNLLEEHVKKSPNAFIQPIIDVLMELGTDAQHIDYAKVSQIITLIQTLLERLREGLRDRETSHTRSVDDLNNLITHTEEIVKSSLKNITILDERIKEIQSRLDKLSGLNNDLKFLQSAVSKAKNTTEDDCKKAETTYKDEDAARTR